MSLTFTRCSRLAATAARPGCGRALSRIQPIVRPSTATTTPTTTLTRSFRSIVRKPRVSSYDIDPSLPTLQATQAAALARKAHALPERCGVLALKKGMTAWYNPESGERTPCTVLQLDHVEVVAVKTVEKNGYFAVQLGAGFAKPKNVTLPMQGHYAAADVSPKKILAEFRVKSADGLPPIRSVLRADWLKVGQFVDVQGVSKGKGFAGGMKKHGWAGQPASHGQSKTHRTMGSAGGSQGSGSRVIPGKNMAGRMGNENVTVPNVKVIYTDTENGIVLVKGCVPGNMGAYVKVRDALRKPWPEVEPVPDSILPCDVQAGEAGSGSLPPDSKGWRRSRKTVS